MNKTTKTLQVVNTWENETALIVHMAPLDEHRTLQNDLFWFDGHPDFCQGQQYTDMEFIEKAQASHMYKQRTFRSWDDIPDDVSMTI